MARGHVPAHGHAFGRVGKRLREAAKLGFSAAIIPSANATRGRQRVFEELELHPVSRIDEALDVVRSLS